MFCLKIPSLTPFTGWWSLLCAVHLLLYSIFTLLITNLCFHLDSINERFYYFKMNSTLLLFWRSEVNIKNVIFPMNTSRLKSMGRLCTSQCLILTFCLWLCLSSKAMWLDKACGYGYMWIQRFKLKLLIHLSALHAVLFLELLLMLCLWLLQTLGNNLWGPWIPNQWLCGHADLEVLCWPWSDRDWNSLHTPQ